MKNKQNWWEDNTQFYTTLLDELDELLDYWQDKLLTETDTKWVQRKIDAVKITMQVYYCELERLNNK